MMKHRILMGTTVMVTALALAGCATTSQNGTVSQPSNTARGVGIGAIAGVALGALTNGGSTALALGGAMGGITGGAIGNGMDRQAAQLQTDLKGTGIQVVKQTTSIKLVMPSNITFDFDKASIKPQFYTSLNKVAASLQNFATTSATVAGYTDSVGSKAYNVKLSQRRADAVANYLESKGIASSRLQTVGYGMSDPVASNATDDGRAQNRRVEMTIHEGSAQ